MFFLVFGADNSSGLYISAMILNGLGFIGLAICLFDWPSGDFYEISSLAFWSISMPTRRLIESIPSRSSLIFLSGADEIPPLESQVFE